MVIKYYDAAVNTQQLFPCVLLWLQRLSNHLIWYFVYLHAVRKFWLTYLNIIKSFNMFGEAESSLLQERDTILSDFLWGVCGYFSCTRLPGQTEDRRTCIFRCCRHNYHLLLVFSPQCNQITFYLSPLVHCLFIKKYVLKFLEKTFNAMLISHRITH